MSFDVCDGGTAADLCQRTADDWFRVDTEHYRQNSHFEGVRGGGVRLTDAVLQSYLDGLPGEQGAGGSAAEAPALVQLDQAFVILQSHSGRDAGTAGAPVHLSGAGWGGD